MRFGFKYTLFFSLFLSFFTIASTLNASTQSDFAEVQKQIDHESAILHQNPNAAPSPKLKKLQKKKIQIQRDNTKKVVKNLDNASKTEATILSDKLIENRENIKNAADGALSVMDTINDELDAESAKLKTQIDKITDHRDVSEFLSKVDNTSKDAKRVRLLNRAC